MILINSYMDRIIISDTSCLIALSNIGMLHIIKDLYDEIIITSEVKVEFGEILPDWIIVMQVKDTVKQADIEKRLDKGEASSIALALEIPNSILIIDEIKGRNIAKSLNIEIIGTVGILLLASNKGLINDVISVILKLVNKGFRLSDKLLDKIIEKYGRQ
jgi:predicted nucleic acid-binding protein